MIRYKSVVPLAGSVFVDYKAPTIVYSESLTDKSHFVPMSEAVKRLAQQPALGRDVIASIYDFADGRDTGMAVPLSRNKGVDMAELSVSIRNDEAAMLETIKADKQRKADQITLDKLTSQVINTPTNVDNSAN